MSLRQMLSLVLLALVSLTPLSFLPALAQEKERRAVTREPAREESRAARRLEEERKLAAERKEKRAEKASEQQSEKMAEKSEDDRDNAWAKKHPIVNGLICTIIVAAAVFYIVGHIMLILSGFRTGILWGLAVLFVPLVPFVYIVVHWAEAKKAVNWMATGIAIGLLSAIFSGVIRGAWH